VGIRSDVVTPAGRGVANVKEAAVQALPKSESRANIGRKGALRERGLLGPDTPLRRMAKELEDASHADKRSYLGGRWVELVFDREPRSATEPVVVFHHIRKTAGTSVKRTIERNFPNGSAIVLLYPDASPAELRTWWEDLFSSMTEEEQGTLRAVSSHSAGFCIDLVPGRAVGITMVRDPIDQVLSRWFFMAQRAHKEMSENLDRLREIYRGKAHAKDQNMFNWFNPQARTLLEPHFDLSGLEYSTEPPPDANLWRARLFALLSRHFVVGVQDKFDDSLQRFTEEVGWTLRPHLEAPTAKVNSNRPDAYPLDAELAKMIKSANWLDFELHAEYSRAFGGLVRTGNTRRGRGTGYVIEKPASGDDPVADLRAQFDEMRDQFSEESQALRLRLRTVELELAQAHAQLGVRHPIKRAESVRPDADEETRAARRRLKRERRAGRREDSEKRSRAEAPGTYLASDQGRSDQEKKETS
jgi:hypothetical protein